MNILFLSRFDMEDMQVWSGTAYHVYKKLQETHTLKSMGKELIPQLECYRSRNFPSGYRPTNPGSAEILCRLLSERIQAMNCDVVFFGDLFFVPYLHVEVPIVHFSDVTYEQFRNYLGVKDKDQDAKAIELERLSLHKYSRIIYSSEWAKRNAVDYYGVDPGKFDVVEFGANIPTPSVYQTEIDTSVCNLVFIGRNWKKKGGDKALNAYRKLKSEKFACTLTIIGSSPDVEPEEDPDLTVIPFLDKTKPNDLERLCTILYNAHFLVLPTEYDAFGIVLCEASAYGVPCLTTNVCGVGQVIREGKNGYLLSPSATADDYAGTIKTVFTDRENYLNLRLSSRREFETRLNWDVWAGRVNEILEEVVAGSKNRLKD